MILCRFLPLLIMIFSILHYNTAFASERIIYGLVKKLGSVDDRERLSAVEKLASFREKALPFLDKSLEKSNSRLETTGALLCLKKMKGAGKPETLRVLSFLNNKDAEIRFAAVDALVWIDPEPKITVEPLSGCLMDEDMRVRYVAATALGRMGALAESSAPFLLQSLDSGNAQAAWALSRIGLRGDPVYDGLVSALKNENYLVRAQSIKALGVLFPGKSVEIIKASLADSSEYVAKIAENTLLRINPELSVEIEKVKDTARKAESSDRSDAERAIFMVNPLPVLKK